MCHCNNRDFSASRFLSGFENNIPLSALEKGWESRRSTGFPNRHLRDSWTVGFWRTDHANQDDGCGLDDGFAGVQGVALATRDKGRDDKIPADPFFTGQRNRLVALAARYALPASYPFREYAVAGGLMSYGPSLGDVNRLVGSYTGKSLRVPSPPTCQFSRQ
jgi:hypothetical protein